MTQPPFTVVDRDLPRQLALWAGDNGEGESYWLEHSDGVWFLERPGVESVAAFSHSPLRPDGTIPHHVPPLESVESLHEALRAIVRHIGQDHVIRRSLLWTVKPGTLASFRWHEGAEGWLLSCPLDRIRSHLYSRWPNPDPTVATNYTEVPGLDRDTPWGDAWETIARIAQESP